MVEVPTTLTNTGHWITITFLIKNYYEMSIISHIYDFFKSIFNFWKGLSDEQKQKTIDVIVENFDPFMRKFYKKTKEEN